MLHKFETYFQEIEKKKKKPCHTSTTIVHVLFLLTADAKPLHNILNQTSQSVLHARCTSYKLIKNTETLLFATYRNISVVWCPKAIVSLWDSFLESFRYILVWAALATELPDKYICSAAHTHSNGNNSSTGQFESDSHTSSHAVFDEQCWHSLSEPEEQSKLTAVKVACVFYTRALAHMSSEKKIAAANE